MAIRKSSKGQCLKRILKRCLSLGKKDSLPDDVPRGHFAVYFGQNRSRHIIPIAWLSLPEFQPLLRLSEEEFGFNHDMGLTIPCEDIVFRTLASMFR
ncbi:PREDICTED: auxin-induced protein 15A-like [Tarenaya hassleriana]|uniref:auxin-induced protein 15A-like n=1 Tax=Tarenaya hassleriana TaxID=28532 RepID=UPI00053C68F5|nr:PREDICTED: auxin-induced protein 15A-like [Tarenaya hassleriana]